MIAYALDQLTNCLSVERSVGLAVWCARLKNSSNSLLLSSALIVCVIRVTSCRFLGLPTEMWSLNMRTFITSLG